MVVLMAIPPDRNMHSDKASPSTSEGRKSSKPIMEKRRRARINASLSELKSLLLEVIKKEGSRHSKMEKADILEMTVKHLRQLQRQQFTGSPKTDSNVLNNYRLGFDECAQEVTRYLSQMEVCDVELRSRILSHLANCVSSGIFNPSPPTTPVSGVPPSVSPASQASSSSTPPQLPPLPPIPVSSTPQQSQICTPFQHSSGFSTYMSLTSATATTSQQVQMVGGVQVIPTKLQTGEIALVLPGNVLNSGGQVPSYIIPVYSEQRAENPQLQQCAIASTIPTPNIISSLPFIPPAPQILPTRPNITTASATAIPTQFVSVTSGQLSLQPPSISAYRPNIALFTPGPTLPSATVTSQTLPPDPIALPTPPNHDQNQAMPRPEHPGDDSMWRPW